MKIGYERVSTVDQNLGLQRDALEKDGCEKIFTDKASGTRTDRPGLAEALKYTRPHQGDTLVVWKLDRLGRSLPHLIETIASLEQLGIGFRSITENLDTTTPGGRLLFHIMGALAQFERDLIRERTNAGLASAIGNGVILGRKPKLDAKGKSQLQRLYNEVDENGNRIHHRKDLCRTFSISEATLYRIVNERGAVSDAP